MIDNEDQAQPDTRQKFSKSQTKKNPFLDDLTQAEKDQLSSAKEKDSTFDDLKKELEAYKDIAAKITSCMKASTELALLETNRNIKVYGKSLSVKLAMLPIALILYITAVICIAQLAAMIFNSGVAGIAVSLVIQGIILFVLYSKSKNLSEKINYKHTKEQFSEIKNELDTAFRR